MKSFISKQKNCLLSLLGVIFLCEFLLGINNKITQSMGIILSPVIAILVFFIIRNDQKSLTK